MDYYKYQDSLSDIYGYIFLEVEDGYAIRQIFKSSMGFIASNRKDEEYDFLLSEGYLDFSGFESNVIKINPSKFNSVWLEYKKELLNEWEETKNKFRINQEIMGTIEVFYPQGILINLENNIVAIADYEECKNSTIPERLYPNHTIRAVIKGYDEENLWLILKESMIID
ncbi:MAG: hypothetical protein Q8936_07625 [Bacillota bacterium]|nr:hypothetical protein [Bacillota bacterium]